MGKISEHWDRKYIGDMNIYETVLAVVILIFVIGIIVVTMMGTTYVFRSSVGGSGVSAASQPTMPDTIINDTTGLSTTTADLREIDLVYKRGHFGEFHRTAYVFSTTQNGRKYTCFYIENSGASPANPALSCTRDFQEVY